MKEVIKVTWLIVFVFSLSSCEKENQGFSYQDIQNNLEISFEQQNDWTYKACLDNYVSIINYDGGYWIEIDKNKTDQNSLDSLILSENNIHTLSEHTILNQGETIISDNAAFFWEWSYVEESKFEVFVTYYSGYIYRFKYSAETVDLFNKSKKEFEAFIKSIVIE